jgi:hypothetical protein
MTCGIGPYCTPGSVTIEGEHVPGFGPFSLTVKGGGGYAATDTGRFTGKDELRGIWADELRGIWAQPSRSDSLILERCTPTSFC